MWAVRGGKVVFVKGVFVEIAKVRVLVLASLSACLLFACVEMARAAEVPACMDGGTAIVCTSPVASDLVLDGINAVNILYVYSWGMGVVLTMWALGYAAGYAIAVIKAL